MPAERLVFIRQINPPASPCRMSLSLPLVSAEVMRSSPDRCQITLSLNGTVRGSRGQGSVEMSVHREGVVHIVTLQLCLPATFTCPCPPNTATGVVAGPVCDTLIVLLLHIPVDRCESIDRMVAVLTVSGVACCPDWHWSPFIGPPMERFRVLPMHATSPFSLWLA
jgi:hypothetical protein|uniref:Uncharacterized protein n=1 Tax=Eutreptiella gymnastica TaxID=73025 RepID=A0A7S4LFK8_9EUGL